MALAPTWTCSRYIELQEVVNGVGNIKVTLNEPRGPPPLGLAGGGLKSLVATSQAEREGEIARKKTLLTVKVKPTGSAALMSELAIELQGPNQRISTYHESRNRSEHESWKWPVRSNEKRKRINEEEKKGKKEKKKKNKMIFEEPGDGIVLTTFCCFLYGWWPLFSSWYYRHIFFFAVKCLCTKYSVCK